MIVDIIAIIAFLVAFYFSQKNNEITKFASSVWSIFSILCTAAVLWILFYLIDFPFLAFVGYAFLVGFITCFIFLSVKENIKLY